MNYSAQKLQIMRSDRLHTCHGWHPPRVQNGLPHGLARPAGHWVHGFNNSTMPETEFWGLDRSVDNSFICERCQFVAVELDRSEELVRPKRRAQCCMANAVDATVWSICTWAYLRFRTKAEGLGDRGVSGSKWHLPPNSDPRRLFETTFHQVVITKILGYLWLAGFFF